MLRSDFYYDLPEQLIAQHPCDKRDHSRLMYLNKTNGDIFHYHFYDIIDLLNPGDCLILNDSRVIPARLYGNREDTGTQVELSLIHILENYEIGMRAYAAIIDFDTMYNNRKPEKQFKPLPRFPAVTRDIAFLCDDSIPVLTLQRAISSAAGDHLESISLFDVYKGKQIPNGKKSVAYNMVLRSKDSTLTDTDADAIMKRIIKALTALGAELRS